MINAGAIITCSLLKTLIKPEMTLAEKFDYTLSYFRVSNMRMHWAVDFWIEYREKSGHRFLYFVYYSLCRKCPVVKFSDSIMQSF